MEIKKQLLGLKDFLMEQCTEQTEVVYTKIDLPRIKLDRKVKDTYLTLINGSGWMAWASAYYHRLVLPDQMGWKEMLLALAPFVGIGAFCYDLPRRKEDKRMIQFFENEIYLEEFLELLKHYEFKDIFEMEQTQCCEPELAWNMFAALLNEIPDQRDEFMSGKSFDEIETRRLIEDDMLYSLKKADLNRLVKATATFEDRGRSKTFK